MDWTGLAGLLNDYGACLQQDTELHKQTATSRSSRHAPYSLKRSLIFNMHNMHVPFDLSLAVKTCRATSRQYDTAKLTEVTGSSQAVALLLLRG